MYEYEADVVRVVDGDTVDVIFDLGFGIMFGNPGAPVRLRLYNINAPEIHGVKKGSEEYNEGMAAKEWLQDRIEGKRIVIRTIKDKTGKYGRYLAILIQGGENLNGEMVKLGYAQQRSY